MAGINPAMTEQYQAASSRFSQLYPATLLARLVTLELSHRDQA